jgi:hypothetical protein
MLYALAQTDLDSTETADNTFQSRLNRLVTGDAIQAARDNLDGMTFEPDQNKNDIIAKVNKVVSSVEGDFDAGVLLVAIRDANEIFASSRNPKVKIDVGEQARILHNLLDGYNTPVQKLNARLGRLSEEEKKVAQDHLKGSPSMHWVILGERAAIDATVVEELL